MHAATRPQVVGGASALAVGALAVGALVAPFAAPNVDIPVATAPVALSAAVTPIGPSIAGVLGSTAQGLILYPADGIFIGSNLVTEVKGLIQNPSTIPATIIGLPAFTEQLTELIEQQSTGVIAGGTTQVPVPSPPFPGPVTTGYTLPGQFVPQTRIPEVGVLPQLWSTTATVNAPATAGFLAAATIVDNNTPSVLPKLATPIVRGAGEVGTSFIQAGGLVRSASVTAVQNTLNAAATLNPTAVRNAVVNGVDGVTKSVIGDSSVPKVTPQPGTGLGIVSPNPATNTVSPVKRLGAIQTVTQTTAKAIQGVATAAGA